jgi:hypothetical protein
MKLIAAFALMIAVAVCNAGTNESEVNVLFKKAQELRNQRNLVSQNVFLSPDQRRVEELKLINQEMAVLRKAIALKKEMETSRQ